MPELGARFYERGPQKGLIKLAAYLQEAAPRAGLAIADYEMAANQYSDLCFAGLFRQRIFGYRSEPPSAQEIRRAVTSGVDLFMRGYAAPAAGPGS